MSDPKQPKHGPQWHNSYEAQLSDELLRWLHASLLERELKDKEIIAKLPPWKSGPRKGQPVSPATLSNIRDRLEMEESNTEDAATTESIIEELKRETPKLSDEEIDGFGNRIFSLLTIRKRNLAGFLNLRSALTKGKLEAAKLALAERAEARQQQALDLEKNKFEFNATKAAMAALPALLAIKRDASLSEDAKLEQARLKLFGSAPK